VDNKSSLMKFTIQWEIRGVLQGRRGGRKGGGNSVHPGCYFVTWGCREGEEENGKIVLRMPLSFA